MILKAIPDEIAKLLTLVVEVLIARLPAVRKTSKVIFIEHSLRYLCLLKCKMLLISSISNRMSPVFL